MTTTTASTTTTIDEGYLHLTLDSNSNWTALEESLRRISQTAEHHNGDSCKEARISMQAPSIGQAVILSLLTTLFQSQPTIEKITFDSGRTNDSNTIPFQAIGTTLAQAKALKRLDLSYIQVSCSSGQEELNSWQPQLPLQAPLEQCCLDRCSVINTDFDTNNGEESSVESDEGNLSLDALISLFLRACPKLEWFTVCSDRFGALTTETLIKLCRAPSLKELMLWNFDLGGDHHLVAFFHALSTARGSKLVRLTLPTTLTPNGAQAVAQYLQQPPQSSTSSTNPPSLQGLTLTVNQFVKNGIPTTEKDVIQEILSILADALNANQSLQSFRLRGSSRISSQKLFADMMVHNYTLQYFSILNRDEGGPCCQEDAAKMELYLKLNRNGRRGLLFPQVASSHQWVKVMVKLRDDLSCLFYLLQTNPSLCGS